ncbi:metal-dependent hydrolase [Candidatus Woesearchaeota archaeon]|nr:metal-dependent hydrolase [Candidatus Woesearchaeota archaeon]
MIFRTHLAFSFLIGLIAYYFNFVDNWILFFLFLFIGAGFPDVDNKNSRFGKNILSRITTVFSRHRKIFHSLIFGATLSYLFFIYDKDTGLGFFLGFLSHLILDAFTKEGINFFYPFGKINVKGFVRTGGKLETILFFIFVTIDTFLFFIIST